MAPRIRPPGGDLKAVGPYLSSIIGVQGGRQGLARCNRALQPSGRLASAVAMSHLAYNGGTLPNMKPDIRVNRCDPLPLRP